jgi:hypothetical protein
MGVPPSCRTTPGIELAIPRPPNDKLPSYGYGSEPVYLSGQNTWYASGEGAYLLIDSSYNGPLTIRGQREGDETSMARFSSATEVDVPAGSSAPFWRVWSGLLSFDKAGCYSLSVTGTGIDERIVVYAHGGSVPPG